MEFRMSSQLASQPTTVSIETLTRRAQRAWWADGLWDFAIAGLYLLLGVWMDMLVRTSAFPSWTWPWPFATTEAINPMRDAIRLWMFAILPAAGLYSWGVHSLVQWLRSRWLAQYQGEVKHSFWMRIDPKAYTVHILIYLGLLVVLVGLSLAINGGPHWYSMVTAAAPAGILFAIGSIYTLKRYKWVAVIGTLLAGGADLFLTTTANYQLGPQSFFDVSAQYGNPALTMLIWSAVLVVSGAMALAQVVGRGAGYEQS
jgi:hypothetical protein